MIIKSQSTRRRWTHLQLVSLRNFTQTCAREDRAPPAAIDPIHPFWSYRYPRQRASESGDECTRRAVSKRRRVVWKASFELRCKNPEVHVREFCV